MVAWQDVSTDLVHTPVVIESRKGFPFKIKPCFWNLIGSLEMKDCESCLEQQKSKNDENPILLGLITNDSFA